MNPTHYDDDRLLLYRFDELPAAERQQIAEHLQSCPACRASLDELDQTLASVPRPEVSLTPGQLAVFNDRVLRRARRRAPNRMPVWGGALAAAGALAVTLVVMQPGAPPPSHKTQGLADYEVLENLDMLQDLDLLQNLDLLQAISDSGEVG